MTLYPPGVCDLCFGSSLSQYALRHGSCSEHLEALWCPHEHCDNDVTRDNRLWNEMEQVWEFLVCYSCLGTTSAECAEHGGSCLTGMVLIDLGDAAPQSRRHWLHSPGVENGWTMDISHLPLALQEEEPPVSQDQVNTHLAFFFNEQLCRHLHCVTFVVL